MADASLETPLPPPPIRGVWRADERARAAYAEGAGIYRIVPRAVCRPADVAELPTLLRWAGEYRVPLVPRGAGSAMGGGNVGTGVVVDLTGLADPPLVVDPELRRARTGAPVTLAALNRAAATHGLRLPPDPSSGRWATVAGVVSTNAAGARTVRYGSVRRWVEAVSLVTVDGDQVRLARGSAAGTTSGAVAGAVARFARDAAPAIAAAREIVAERFPRTRKNSAGYALDAYLASGDLVDLVIGSEGTLGLVTEVEWRLDPVPSRSAGLRIALASLDQLGELVAALAPAQPSAVELLDRSFLDLVREVPMADALRRVVNEAGALVLVELEAQSEPELVGMLETAAEAGRRWGTSVEAALAAPDVERLWAIRHAASPILASLPEDRRSLQVIEDACVPVERIGDYIRAVRAAAERRRLTVVCFGHAGDGNIHVNLLPEIGRPGWEILVASLLDEVTTALLSLGGTTTGEHGDGRLRAGFLETLYGHDVVELFRRVKAAFDPLGILNPGIILPDGSPPIQHLKVGSDAAPLPPDVARGLREIEQRGGYARDRLEIADHELR